MPAPNPPDGQELFASEERLRMMFNHAAVGYLDTTGAFHILVVGGDDVNAPTKKRKGVFYY